MSQSKTNSPLPEWLNGIEPRALNGVDAQLFTAVRDSYDSPGRYYHAWPHILACLAEYRMMKFDRPRAVLLALLFHDAIYVTGNKDNEARSADLAVGTAAAHSDVTDAERDEIAQMILLTASHHAPVTLSDDARKMLDIDLSILGAEWQMYDAYAVGVRRELCPAVIGEFKFRIGRIKFLRSVLQQQHIFLTEGMRRRLESGARENIAREIAALEREAGLFGRVIARI